MNANEVIANLAGEGVHPNDHVNMGQSSNDVFPSAVHLAAVSEATDRLLPGARRARDARSSARPSEFADLVKAGRTHMMDAVPVTLGQEFGGYAAQIRLGRRPRARRPAAGHADPARRHRHRHRPEHAPRVRRSACAKQLGLGEAPADPFEAQGNRDALVELSGALKVVAVSLTKIANDLVLMGSGPRTGLVELRAARAPEGLLDHAGQGQPGDPRGGAPGGRPGDRQRRRDHDGRHPGQLRAERAGADDRPQPAALDRDPRERLDPARPRSAWTASRPTRRC